MTKYYNTQQNTKESWSNKVNAAKRNDLPTRDRVKKCSAGRIYSMEEEIILIARRTFKSRMKKGFEPSKPVCPRK
jgi:DNA primase large subunit